MIQDNFYLLGFIYLLLLIRKLYKYSIPVAEEDTLKIDETTSISDLSEIKNIDKKTPIIDRVWTILDMLCFFWLIMGVLNNKSDKILFIFQITIIAIYWLFVIGMIIYSVIMVLNNSRNNINTSNDTIKNKKKPIELTKTLVVTELIIVICILAKYYFSI